MLTRLLPILTLIYIIGCWEIGVRFFEVPEYILPRPSSILQAFQFIDFEQWLRHTWATVRVSLLAFTISFVIALLTAFAHLIENILYRRLSKKFEKTANFWDDSFLKALHKPLLVLIWVVGISLAAQIAAATVKNKTIFSLRKAFNFSAKLDSEIGPSSS